MIAPEENEDEPVGPPAARVGDRGTQERVTRVLVGTLALRIGLGVVFLPFTLPLGVVFVVWAGVQLGVVALWNRASNGPRTPSTTMTARLARVWIRGCLLASVVATLLVPDLLGIFCLLVTGGEYFLLRSARNPRGKREKSRHQPAGKPAGRGNDEEPSDTGKQAPAPTKVEIPFFTPAWFRKGTVIAAYGIVVVGLVVSIGALDVGLRFLLLGIGEVALYFLYKHLWYRLNGKVAREGFRPVATPLERPWRTPYPWACLVAVTAGLGLGIYSLALADWFTRTVGLFGGIDLVLVGMFGLYFVTRDAHPYSAARYVFLSWAFAMVMEFAVDFGAYGVMPWVNPHVVLVIMLTLSPHYFVMAAVFRLWFHWYPFTARQAYFTMGAVGFVLEAFLLKLVAGIFNPGEMLVYPFYVFAHVLNYGGFVLIPTLYQNQVDARAVVPCKRKYVVAIAGTLAIILPEVWLVYTIIYGL